MSLLTKSFRGKRYTSACVETLLTAFSERTMTKRPQPLFCSFILFLSPSHYFYFHSASIHLNSIRIYHSRITLSIPIQATSIMQFDFSTADWSDDSSPFDQCDKSFSSLDSQQRSPTAIRFSKDADEIFEIPHVSTFSDEQKTARWYQPQDYRFFRLQREHEAVTQARSTESQKSQNDQS